MSTTTNSPRWALFAGIAAVPLLLFGGYLAFVIRMTADWATDLGKFGDSFGAINALFTGLTLAGLLITILQQREELALQHRELLESRKQFKRSATAQEASARLTAYSELLAEYTLRVRLLEDRQASWNQKRQEELTKSPTAITMMAAVAPSPWEPELFTLYEKRDKIVKELEAFLSAAPQPDSEES